MACRCLTVIRRAPTGRLPSTWYAGMDAFPAINSYVVPEGNSSGLDTINPRFTVDMTNADPIESGLTSMYTDAEVTYPLNVLSLWQQFGQQLLSCMELYSKLILSDDIFHNTLFLFSKITKSRFLRLFLILRH